MSAGAGRALIVLLVSAVPALACGSQERAPPALGLCPPDARRSDSYMQALCEGEAALGKGSAPLALERFRVAAELPRVAATNEMAWAGLAAAHCRVGQFDDGQRWAAHFAQARRLWLGELDCEAGAKEGRAAISPFVRSRMCSERLVADYALVRANAGASYSIDLRTRLNRVSEAVAQACATKGTARATPVDGADTAKGATGKTRGKKRRRSAGTKPASSQAAAKPKPD